MPEETRKQSTFYLCTFKTPNWEVTMPLFKIPEGGNRAILELLQRYDPTAFMLLVKDTDNWTEVEITTEELGTVVEWTEEDN